VVAENDSVKELRQRSRLTWFCACAESYVVYSTEPYTVFLADNSIRPHRSTTYVDAVYCYRPSSVVCPSVCHTSEPCYNGWADRDATWVEDLGGPREPCIRRASRSPHGKGQFWGGNGCLIVKYRDTLRSSVQKHLKRWRCRLVCGLGWAKESCVRWGSIQIPMGRGNFGENGRPL